MMTTRAVSVIARLLPGRRSGFAEAGCWSGTTVQYLHEVDRRPLACPGRTIAPRGRAPWGRAGGPCPRRDRRAPGCSGRRLPGSRRARTAEERGVVPAPRLMRDLGALESAIAQPKATFGGIDLYPTLIDKAAVLGFVQRECDRPSRFK